MDSKEECQSEVEHLLDKLCSWRAETNRQLSDIMDSHTDRIKKGINHLAEEVCDLRTKLSIITEERSQLLNNINRLSIENKKLRDVIQIVQPLQSPQVERKENLDQELPHNSESEDSTAELEDKEGDLNDSALIEKKRVFF